MRGTVHHCVLIVVLVCCCCTRSTVPVTVVSTRERYQVLQYHHNGPILVLVERGTTTPGHPLCGTCPFLAGYSTKWCCGARSMYSEYQVDGVLYSSSSDASYRYHNIVCTRSTWYLEYSARICILLR